MHTVRLLLACWGWLITLLVARQAWDYWRHPPPTGTVSWPGIAAGLLLFGEVSHRLLVDHRMPGWVLVIFALSWLFASISIAQTMRFARVQQIEHRLRDGGVPPRIQ